MPNNDDRTSSEIIKGKGSSRSRKSQEKATPLSQRKPCPVCGEEIAAAAKKCIHCQSELTWKGQLSLSNNSLALITALLAVLGTVGPTIRSLFEHQDAFLNFRYVGAGSVRTMQDGHLTNGSLILLGSNEGHAPGGLVAATLQISWVIERKRHNAAAMLRTQSDEPVVIGPGATQSIRLLFDPRIEPLDGTSITDIAGLVVPKAADRIETMPLWNANCSIGMTIADGSTETKDIIVPARCDSLMPAIVQAIRSPGVGE